MGYNPQQSLHNQIPRCAVRGTPNCPLKDAIVSGVLAHLPAFNISTSGDGLSRVPCGGNWIDSISANSGWGILYLGGGFKYFLILTCTRENDPIWQIFFLMGWNHQLGMIMACLPCFYFFGILKTN